VSEVIDRRIVLGGETRARGIVSGARSRLEWAGMSATALGAVPLIVSSAGSWTVIVAAGAVVAAAFLLWTPFYGPLRGRSVAAVAAHEVRFQVNRRGPEAVFLPRYMRVTAPAAPARRGRRRRKPVAEYDVPIPVGNARVVGAILTRMGELAVVRHSNPGRAHFFTVVLEMRGDSVGLEREHDFGRAHQGWGSFCASLAGDASFIRTVQQVTRVVPYDTADHSMWAARGIPPGTNQMLTDSYIELLDQIAVHTEQHRTWLVLRVPISPRYVLEARRLAIGQEGELMLLEREVEGAMHRAAGYGLGLRPLDESRLSAVIRSLQDPDHPLDMVAEMDWTRSWLAWDTRPRRAVVVAGQDRFWHTRTGVVSSAQVEAGRLSPDFLHPLLSNVAPSVVRTISTVIDLVPAHVARSRARQDVTLDTGAAREALTRVSDGSEEQQLSVSRQRLADLRVSTRNHGAGWSMTITLATPDSADLASATRQIEAAAEEAYITEVRWMDGWHAAGLVTSLPLARGMAVRR
jgi:hypothetical protein